MKKQSKLIIGITAGILLIAVIVIVAVLMASGSNSKKYARHMESAQRYMDELDYEQAIAEYEAAIEIEPNNAEAYRALAELYAQTGDYESAIAVLNQGIKQTGVEELSEYIEAVQTAYEGQKALAEEMTQVEESQFVISDVREEINYNADGSYQIDEYDASGSLIKSIHYYSDGTLDYYMIYEYDVKGHCIAVTQYDADDKITFTFIDEYDESWNVVKHINCFGDGTVHDYIIYEYDEDGNNVKYTTYNMDGEVRFYHIFEYDSEKNLVKDTYYWGDGTIGFVEEYGIDGNYTNTIYDEEGNPVKTIFYNADGTVREILVEEVQESSSGSVMETVTGEEDYNQWGGYAVREYDLNGKLINKIWRTEDGVIVLVDEYNEKEELVKQTYYNVNGTVNNYAVYEYDENGNRVKRTYYNADGTVDNYYVEEYDANGDRVKETYYNADGSIINVYEY